MSCLVLSELIIIIELDGHSLHLIPSPSSPIFFIPEMPQLFSLFPISSPHPLFLSPPLLLRHSCHRCGCLRTGKYPFTPSFSSFNYLISLFSTFRLNDCNTCRLPKTTGHCVDSHHNCTSLCFYVFIYLFIFFNWPWKLEVRPCLTAKKKFCKESQIFITCSARK